MIINESTGCLFLEIPKTGSTTVRLAYQAKHGRSKYASVWTHIKKDQLQRVMGEFFSEIDYSKLTHYAFYRDPIERLVSGWRYSISQWEKARTDPKLSFEVYSRGAALFHLIWGKKFNIDEKPTLNNVTLDEYLTALESRAFFTTVDLLSLQTEYINDNTVLLNYHDYEAEYNKLVPLLDLPSYNSAGRQNSTDAADYYDTVTTEQAARIKAFYKADYDFFEKKGITFVERSFV